MALKNVKDNWFETNPKKTFLLLFLLFFILLEVTVRLLAYHGMVHYRRFNTGAGRVYADILSKDFGQWHYPNATYQHSAACFDVTLKSNSYGARDIERAMRSSAKNRAVVLGDSFVEGVGVNTQHRMTDIIERASGIEHLNFGSSGSSSVQEWLLYQTLASRFDHSDVFIFLLPHSDMPDNTEDPHSEDRTYQPFLRKIEDGFELYYPMKFEDRPPMQQYSPYKIFRRKLYNTSYVLNLFRQFDVDDFLAESNNRDEETKSYGHYTATDGEILRYVYARIAKIGQDKRVIIFVIPLIANFQQYYSNGYDFRLVEMLENFAKQHTNIEVVDLLPYFIRYSENQKIEPREFFHSCDGHWSLLGNKVAADAVLEYRYNKSLFDKNI